MLVPSPRLRFVERESLSHENRGIYDNMAKQYRVRVLQQWWWGLSEEEGEWRDVPLETES